MTKDQTEWRLPGLKSKLGTEKGQLFFTYILYIGVEMCIHHFLYVWSETINLLVELNSSRFSAPSPDF